MANPADPPRELLSSYRGVDPSRATAHCRCSWIISTKAIVFALVALAATGLAIAASLSQHFLAQPRSLPGVPLTERIERGPTERQHAVDEEEVRHRVP